MRKKTTDHSCRADSCRADTRGSALTPEALHRKHKCTLWILTAVLILFILLSFTLGRYKVPLKELVGILINSIFGGIEPYWTDSMQTAVLNIRMPRILLSVLVGGALSGAGAAYQGVFQNPMAAPDILGASAGAGFGAALAILFGLSSLYITMSAFALSMISVALVFWISRHVKGQRVMRLILSGIMIGSVFQAGTSFIKLAADPNNKLLQITYWLMGSLSGAEWSDVLFSFPPILLALIPLLLLSWRINILAMGDDEANALGVDAHKVRRAVLVCSTLLTASAVSVSGMIGWVGLVIPHMMRRLVGSEYRYLMPASILGGACFLLAVDNTSRCISSAGIPIGILTAFIGAPFFLWLITGRRENYEY